MFLRFEENPNIGFVDDRVFQERSQPRAVTHVLRIKQGKEVWCSVVGLNNVGQPQPAQACKVDDSGEGTCWLLYGGLWGLRLSDDENADWSVDDPSQWGEPFLLLPSDGEDLRFADA
jgi:hypothetical protein